ncbi:MAG: methyltransferase domain-containing protein [Chlamydiota bacterium]
MSNQKNFYYWMLTALLFSSPLLGDLKNELAFDKDWPYQDLLINGEMLKKGVGPDCPSRFEAIRPLLNRFKRPFTVLDIGANNGYFSLRILENYDATCILIDGTERLQKICELNSEMGNLAYLKKFITADDIERLAQEEHFDVVLCFHVLHHVDWRRFTSALFKLGDYVIIETPPVNDGFVPLKPTIPEIANYLLSLPFGMQIGSFARQSPTIRDHMILFSQPSLSPFIKRDFEIAMRYQPITQKWEPLSPGISVATFKNLNGSYSNFPLKPGNENE